ncbi:hypothetical protein C900_04020 [Fulvivirga imtechensis AK7]|uniref:Uncharacterized protein n=1 Tax=Fulvivirga imtechensis AK7 TaxID=1237149 RepID=L8JND8_9BACT|nr:hypothetical protein [Fulvivirga imtechensis]ELR70335.1 hypothetical protein C900_04020 [Fulvivirga imtechensis AK7]
MAKRLLRIPAHTIPEKWAEISGKKVNIVFGNGGVLLATLLQLKNGNLEIKDTRLAKQKLDLNQISEIILDY